MPNFFRTINPYGKAPLAALFIILSLVHGVYIAAGGDGGNGSVAHCGGELADILCPAVARDEDTRSFRQAVFARGEPAALVDVRKRAEALVRGLVADGDEEPVKA